ncbi:hypothetical protein D1V04_18120 [Salmonella enterica]|nr:hypothetical protein [Salmonella enterica]EAW1057426.1 hypothetical protein [Salmonella enterica]EBM5603663.1 hypothetical protein [Salmonella enterica]EBN1284526.1 hypothetical protein [Salmonella enterica]
MLDGGPLYQAEINTDRNSSFISYPLFSLIGKTGKLLYIILLPIIYIRVNNGENTVSPAVINIRKRSAEICWPHVILRAGQGTALHELRIKESSDQAG